MRVVRAGAGVATAPRSRTLFFPHPSARMHPDERPRRFMVLGALMSGVALGVTLVRMATPPSRPTPLPRRWFRR